ncbi:MAG: hypothetical protein QM673_17175 [Gordonia sp. (in: high G+C Gram-positive bacteria)]
MTNESPVAAEHAFQLPDWLAYSVAVSTTVGVLVALFVAFWNVSKNRRERQELRAAQARKVVPAATHSEILGPRMWVLAVLNQSDAMVRRLEVEVTGHDADGREVENAAELANDKADISGAFSKLTGLGPIAGMVSQGPVSPQSMAEQLARMWDRGQIPGYMVAAQSRPNPKDEIRKALGAYFISEWPTALTPHGETSMLMQAAETVRKLTVTITFEDEAGYQWRRTDDGMPELIRSGLRWPRRPWSQ